MEVKFKDISLHATKKINKNGIHVLKLVLFCFQVTPYDAEAITFYMATVAPDGLLPIETISFFQRKQMDPNYDWLFNDTPCIVSNQNHFCILVEGRI